MTPNYHAEQDWYGCYPAGQSRDDVLFTQRSLAHPAKMSIPLLERIIQTMRSWGWLQVGSLVVDPFGGRGTTAAVWCAMDPLNRAATVELEPHFVEIQRENKAHAERKLGRPLDWTILQGDSRKADEVLQAGGVALTSPPYGKDTIGRQSEQRAAKLRALTKDPTSSIYGRDPDGPWFKAMAQGYGTTPGNIDLLPDGDAAVLSPPYTGDEKKDRTHDARDARWQERRTINGTHGAGCFRGSQTYGETEGQIGSMACDVAEQADVAISSPPYCDMHATDARHLHFDDRRRNASIAAKKRDGVPTGYGDTDGQIGVLPDTIEDVAILSPPYLEQQDRARAGKVQGGEVADCIGRAYDSSVHGDSPGQIAAMPAGEEAAGVLSPPYLDLATRCGGNGVWSLGSMDAKCDYIAPEQEGNIGLIPDSGVLSPPYMDAQIGTGQQGRSGWRGYTDFGGGETAIPGQIAAMPADEIAITSPPYEDAVTDQPNGIDMAKSKRAASGRKTSGRNGQVGLRGYEGEPVDGGTVALTSPPYEDSLASGDPDQKGGLFRDPKRRNDPGLTGQYCGASALTSPPYEAQPGGHNVPESGSIDRGVAERHSASRIGRDGGYADNQAGQIGALQKETYASAVLDVYRALWRSGVRYLAVVTKNPTRAGKLRRLDLLTWRLLEQAGYEVVTFRRAVLWETEQQRCERLGQSGLFGDDVAPSTKPVGRLSFFAYLHLTKGGVRAQHEDVLFARRRDDAEIAGSAD